MRRDPRLLATLACGHPRGLLAELIPKGQFLEAPGAWHAVHLSHTAWLAGQLTNWLASH